MCEVAGTLARPCTICIAARVDRPKRRSSSSSGAISNPAELNTCCRCSTSGPRSPLRSPIFIRDTGVSAACCPFGVRLLALVTGRAAAAGLRVFSVGGPACGVEAAGSNCASRCPSRTMSPACRNRGPVSLSSLTKVPEVEFRSVMVTDPEGLTVTRACRELTPLFPTTMSAVASRPITVCGCEKAMTFPACRAGSATTSRAVLAVLVVLVFSVIVLYPPLRSNL